VKTHEAQVLPFSWQFLSTFFRMRSGRTLLATFPFLRLNSWLVEAACLEAVDSRFGVDFIWLQEQNVMTKLIFKFNYRRTNKNFALNFWIGLFLKILLRNSPFL
jgi:hypothetical protein